MSTALDVATVKRSELAGMLRNNEALALLETLPEEEYRRGHIPGALNVPMDRLAELAAALVPDRTTPIVVYGSGREADPSTDAARELRILGYIKVRQYRGGKKDWMDHLMPMEGGWDETPPAVPRKSQGPRARGRHRPQSSTKH